VLRHHALACYGKNVNVAGIRFYFPRDVERHVDDIILIVITAAEQKLFAFL